MLIRSFKPCVEGVLVESVLYCYVRCILLIALVCLSRIIYDLPLDLALIRSGDDDTIP